jgi:thiol peroxidase
MSQIEWLAGQAGDFSENVVLVNISVDLPYALKRYMEEKGIENAIFLSDHRDVSFGNNWGVLLEEIRLLARGLFIVDEEGIIRYVQVSHDDLFSKSLDYDDISMSLDELGLFK